MMSNKNTADTTKVLATISQKQMTDRLLGRIRKRAREMKTILVQQQSVTRHYPPDGFQLPRHGNVFGVFGPRGTGKSTILDLVRKSLTDEPRPEQGLHIKVLDRIVDCSLSPSGTPIGLSLLQRMRDCLSQSLEGNRPEGSDDQRTAADECFKRVLNAYVASAKSYQQLAMQLAISPSQYSTIIQSSISQRSRLPYLVMEWLEAEARRFSKDCDETVFVMPLDDVDLTLCPLVRDLSTSLLDELHQPRLLFIFGADQRRLESLVTDNSDRDNSPTTPQAILYKIIPRVDRLLLSPWTPTELLEFSLGDSKAVQFEKMLDRLKPGMALTVLGALPTQPRGIENLYRKLSELPSSAHSSNSPSPGYPGHALLDTSTLLAFLAIGRGDFRTARLFQELCPEGLLPVLEWRDCSLMDEVWHQLVSACKFPSGRLREMKPSNWEHLTRTPGLGTSGAIDRRSTAVSDEDFALWTEILLEDLISREVISPQEIVHRIGFIGKRLEQAGCEGAFLEDQVRGFFEKPSSTIDAELFWLIWETAGEDGGFPFRLGFPPLLDALVRARSIWPSAVMSHFMMGPSQILSRVPEDRKRRDPLRPESSPTLLHSGKEHPEIMPRNIRALLTLVDRLSAMPWGELPHLVRVSHPGSLIRIAAGLVHAAYCEALQALADIQDQEIKLKNGDPTYQDPLLAAFPEDAKLRLDLWKALEEAPADPFRAAFREKSTPDFLVWDDEEACEAFDLIPMLSQPTAFETGAPVNATLTALGQAVEKERRPTPASAPILELYKALVAFEAMPEFRLLRGKKKEKK